VQTDSQMAGTRMVSKVHSSHSSVPKSRQEHLQLLLHELASPQRVLAVRTSTRREPFCQATVAGEGASALIDSGSFISLLPMHILKQIHAKNESLLANSFEPPDQLTLYDVSGREAKTLGFIKLEVSLDGGESKEFVRFAIASFPLEHVILGSELLRGKLDSSPIAIRLAQYLLEEPAEKEPTNFSESHVICSLSSTQLKKKRRRRRHRHREEAAEKKIIEAASSSSSSSPSSRNQEKEGRRRRRRNAAASSLHSQ